MKKIINTLSKAVQVVLTAPIKWPGKVLQIVRYVAVGLGILETVIQKEEPEPTPVEEEEDGEATD